MNNNLYDFFSFLGLQDNQIEFILTHFPGLISRDFNKIVQCVATVTAYGFPKSELPELIMSNPNFMLNKPETIAKTLSLIDDDIEFALLTNPHII